MRYTSTRTNIAIDDTKQTGRLDDLLGHEPLAIDDLILTGVLQGFADERDFNQARKMLTSLRVVELGGQEIAIQAARNCRAQSRLDRSQDLRYRDCYPLIESGNDLLRDTRDFDPFAKHLGLRVM